MSVYKHFVDRLTYDVPVTHHGKTGIVTQVYPDYALWVAQPWDGDVRIVNEANAREFAIEALGGER